MPSRAPSSPPVPPSGSVAVVGAGLAGARTVAALRSLGFEGTVTLLGAEGVAPYDRPPLSKELLDRPGPAWLSDELGIDVTALVDDLRLDDPAVALGTGSDDARPAVRTRSGGQVVADAVVLAVGSEPLRPAGWEAARVLHTADDAAALRALVRPGARLVVVGAGWIGAEVAGVAAGAGALVTVVEAGRAPLERQLGGVVGAHLARWYDDAGVRLVTGSAVVDVRADGVRLADGTDLPADVVLAAVGARPATGWLDGAVPRDARGTVPVDASGAVHGVPGVWAVGDCATREHPLLGHVPGGHWSAALQDPEPTARAILGLDAAPGVAHAPYVFSRQLGHDLALLGVPGDGDAVLFRGDPSGGASLGWSAFYLDPGDAASGVVGVRAVLLVDSPRDVGPVRKAMNRPQPFRLDLAVALDPARHLRDAIA
ncbi:NAD(P)/FAD-dependent oxidoreductase [Cellulosimicrobium marinum]|uniref:NAD(P)/FAD-dependent oxidoreductase n=1 Tax=Cellulosimicrobium marinum TaxID=1638992 RepID=UPI001E5E8FE2|nr:FAD-dependent oxidoreductase [Cellulosimicrobium marinum]MCB7136659.1 NAD(P)/FAD-dependent oxidoreductase [Cellulosimicrobium marinum]